jgi:hypothetical protein
MTQAKSVHSTPRRTASKIQTKKRERKSDLAANAARQCLTVEVDKSGALAQNVRA